MNWLNIIAYRDYWDVPRIFLVRHCGKLLLFDCMKMIDPAIEVFETALIHYPNDHNLETWLADVYMLKNCPESFAKGKAMILRILKAAPEDVFALTIHANRLWTVENKPKEAKKIYQKALKLNPDNYNLLGNLAEIHAQDRISI